MATWPHTTIDAGGHRVEAIAPLIVSASRSTDIPAFYADWFFDRLRAGYSAWTNPFNNATSYVSYHDTRFVVFWSKNPRPLLPYLSQLDERGIRCYIQYTLNDYEAEHFENVPPLGERVETFQRLAERLGKGAVVWRFDPLILTNTLGVDALIDKVIAVGDRLMGYAEKLVFSYADIAAYTKVRANLARHGVAYREWDEPTMTEFARKLSQANKERGWNYTLATCAEKADLASLGIQHNRCIDADLIVRIAWSDKRLMDFMKVQIKERPTLLADDPFGAIMLPGNRYFVSTHRKDPGQRPLCGCMAAKDIGQYNTCPHLCHYCYANASPQSAMANWQRHLANPRADTITGI